MRPRTLLALFLVVAALASFIWFVERDLPGSDERADMAKKVLRFDVAAVSQLSIDNGERSVVFGRQPDAEWRLLEPVAGRAAEDLVERLLDELADLEKERTFSDAEASGLGLAPPRAAVTLAGSDLEARLLIGSEVPASDSMIVASDAGGPYFVAASSVWEAIDRTVDEWRERTIFPGQRADIERLSLARGENRVTIARRGEAFVLESPLTDRADEGTVSRLLDAIVGLEAAVFVDDAAGGEALGFDAGAGTLELSSAGSEEVWRLELGGSASGAEGDTDTPRIYVRVDDDIFIVPDALSGELERSAEGWRSLEWSTREVYEIDRLEITDAVGSISLERDAGDWRRDGVEIEYGPVSDLLYAIAGTKGEALDAQDDVAGVPLVTIVIDAGEGEQVLQIFAPRGDSYPATVSDRDVALWLGGDRVRGILTKIGAVREAAAVADAPEDAGQAPASPDAAAGIDS